MANDSGSKPMYEMIFQTLRERITNNEYKAGERVPSEKELCSEFGVSRITSKKALKMLAEEHLIVRQPGRGSFVADANSLIMKPFDSQQTVRTTGKKRIIGLVITHFSDMYGTELIYGMEEASRENDAFLIVRRSFGIPELEEQAIQQLLGLGVDGLIIFPAQGEYFSAEILKLVIQKFPFVMIDRYLKGIPASSVSTDNIQAAKEATHYLFGLGHRHIGFLAPPPANTTAIEERIDGILEAHMEHNLLANRELWMETITSTMPNVFDPEARIGDVDKLAEHLRKYPQITALFAAEYSIALLVEEAAGKLGLRIPEDLSLICFDSPEPHEDCRVTHMRQNQFSIGKQAYENVFTMQGNEQPISRILLPAVLIKGKSTAPVRKD
ncbi:DNA-binding LacI/PurR family transcriptional regulator [Paenibacillus silagei]|uniref:DNA-binding LacI/PurR family transcriptional regulator n=1 Tax=Paenibacillus silagei TaxID=1670801 RepID=A0ABS4NNL9_9BACL|nr:GntR family transcriptional regulator [Paenibacillus silagei]MBP2111664.1 DNA-binding LacI/PurR family transcriptional regulator [Paenibacillus silagei]